MAIIDEKSFLYYLNNDFPELKVSLHNLDQPSPEFIFKYYSALLEIVTRKSARILCSFSQEQRNYLEMCGNDYSVANHISKRNLYKMVKYIFDRIGLSNFHYSDIILPHLSKHRCLVFMKTMYYFFTTCTEFDECYEDLHDSNDNVNLFSQLQEENFQLKERLLQNEANKTMMAEKFILLKEKLAEIASRYEQSENIMRELENVKVASNDHLRRLEMQEKDEQSIRIKLDGEKMYLESLLIEDENKMLDYHAKLLSKKDECSQSLPILEAKKLSCSTKLGQFEKVLNLQDDMASTLRKEVSIGGKCYDLRSLSDALPMLKTDCNNMAKDEVEIRSKIKELLDKTTDWKQELSLLLEEKNSVTCVWNERLEKYIFMAKDLEKYLLEAKHRSETINGTLESGKREANKLRDLIAEKTLELTVKHQDFNKDVSRLEMDMVLQLNALKDNVDLYCSKNKN